MDKERIEEQFSPLLDGELSPSEREELEAALGEDAEALRVLEEMKRVDSLFRAMPRHAAPADFEARVREALEPRAVRFGERRAPRPRRALWPLAAAAALLVCVAAGVWLQMYGGAPLSFQVAKEERAPMRAAPAATQAEKSSVVEGGQSLPDIAPPPAAGRAEVAFEIVRDSVEEAAPSETAPADDGAMRGAAGVVTETREPVETTEGVRRISKLGTPGSAPAATPPTSSAQSEPPAQSELRAEAVAHDDALETPPAPPAEAAVIAGAELAAESVREREKKDTADERMLEKLGDLAAQEPVLGASPPPASPSALEREPQHLGAQAGIAQRATAEQSLALGAAGERARKVIGETVFIQRGEVWYQDGYNGEKTTRITRGTKAFDEFAKKHKELEAVLELRPRVILRAGEEWYEIDTPPQDDGS